MLGCIGRVLVAAAIAVTTAYAAGTTPVHAQGLWPWSKQNKQRQQGGWVSPWQSEVRPERSPGSRAPAARAPAGGGTYRTLCVRTCDGYYFPISFKATRSKFSADSVSCLQRCSGAGARLFVHRNPGQEIKSAVDLRGNRYVDLEHAFRYRKELVDGCDCKPALWAETGAGAGQAEGGWQSSVQSAASVELPARRPSPN